jgi:hypothetical protein
MSAVLPIPKNKSDKEKLGKAIRETLANIKKNPGTTYFGPVHSHIGTKLYALREEELRLTSKRARALQAELSLFKTPLEDAFKSTRDLSPDAFEETQDGWTYDYEGSSLDPAAENSFFRSKTDSLPSAVPALDLIITTWYLPDDLDFNGQITDLHRALGNFRYIQIPPSDFTNRTFVHIYSMVLWLLSDLTKVIDALDDGDLGRNLKLNSVKHWGPKADKDTTKKAEQKDALDKK